MSTPFAFRVLGPLEVWRGPQQLTVGGDRQRLLLALLLLRANELVSTDELIEQLFGPRAGASAANSLQAGISRLRRALADGEGAVIVTRPHGYLLESDPDRLDSLRFESGLADGRAALTASDPSEAATTLRRALQLWRGPPLADIAFTMPQPELGRLESLRLAATMERIEADLALGRSSELVPELEALVRANPLQERLRGQLMLALYRAERQADALAVYRTTRKLLNDELGLEPSRALQRLERSILQQDASLDGEGAPIVVCPFKGLAPFGASDAAYFFGREQVVEELTARLAGGGFAAVLGPSGSGKSSIVQAGLLPVLRAGALPGSAARQVVLVRPGATPRLPRTGDGPVVIAVDQLEEVFTLCTDEAMRAAFLDGLAEAAGEPGGRALVVVALRADFYGRLVEHAGLARLVSRSHVLVGAMERDELVRAIEQPALRSALTIEPALVDALADDVLGRPGALPLLQATLLELWRQRDGTTLRLAAYLDSGGVEGAVARLAEQAYASMREPEREAARRILLRLSGGDPTAPVRRRVSLDELDTGNDPAVAHALETLTDARLLTVDDGVVEVAHEALLREWPRLRAWLEEDSEGRRIHVHLAAAAAEWSDDRDQADLYRGARLAAALDWLTAHEQEASKLEHEFLAAGRRAAERRLRRLRLLLAGAVALLAVAVAAAAIALVQKRDAQHQARVALAQQLGAEAIVEPRIDRAMLLARQAVELDRSSETEGTLLTTLLRSPTLLGVLPFPITARPSSGGITVSPDGRTLVVGDNHGELRFFDVGTRRESRPAFAGAFGYAPTVFSRDGSKLLTAAAGFPPPGLQLLDAKTLRRRELLRFDRLFLHPPIDTGAVLPLGLSDDSRYAFFAYDLVVDDVGTEGPAYLDRWDVATRRRARVRLGSDNVVAASFLGAGARVVTVTSRAIEMWNTATLRRLRIVRPRVRLGGFASVSPDGRRVAGLQAGTSPRGASVVFIDATTGQIVPAAAAVNGGGVLSIHFAPDSRTVVTTGDNGVVQLWDAATGALLQTLVGHGGRVVASAFSHDGRTLFTDALDGSILEWDVSHMRGFGRPFRIGAQPHELANVPQTPPLAVSPSGDALAVREGRSSVGFYSLPGGRRLRTRRAHVGTVTAVAWSTAELAVAGTAGVALDGRPLSGLRGPVQAVAFSPDGSLVAAVDLKRLAIWRTATRTFLAGRALGLAGTAVAFSPDGALLAVGRDDGSVLVVDATSGTVEHVIRPVGAPYVCLAFSPDGTLITGSWSGILERWNATDGTRIGQPLLAAAAPVASISFGRDPNIFATAGLSDGLVKLWTTSQIEQFGASFPGPPGNLVHAALADQDQVAVYDDATAAVWPTSLSAWETHACAVAGRNLTHEEWRRFVPRHPYAKTCR
jgi:DNA-binding SARP family transcriptional activator/WD40 repeat protein/energy-coupling factor transporter ATP-binding protein EcfA2